MRDTAKVKTGRSFSIIWLVPLVALLIGGGLAVKALSEKGPTVTISFASAEGLEAGKTKIRYKDVEIGTVEEIRLSSDLKHVIVTAELKKDTEKYLTDKTRFWVVRASVRGGTVSGLGTLLAGAYIGIDPSRGGTADQVVQGAGNSSRDHHPPPRPPLLAARRHPRVHQYRRAGLLPADPGRPGGSATSSATTANRSTSSCSSKLLTTSESPKTPVSGTTARWTLPSTPRGSRTKPSRWSPSSAAAWPSTCRKIRFLLELLVYPAVYAIWRWPSTMKRGTVDVSSLPVPALGGHRP